MFNRFSNLPLVTQGASAVKTSAILEIQQERKQHLHQVCASMGFPPNDTSPLDLSLKMFHRIFVFPKYKLLYCSIPKVSCTTWKGLFLYLHGRIKHQQGSISPKETHIMADQVFKKLSQMRPEAARKALEEYTSFVFVRNPYTRLLSAYNNKFVNEPLTDMYPGMIRNWSLKNRLGFIPPLGGESNVSFDEFMRYYIRRTVDKDRHWEDMYKLCHPCHVNYSFIGFFETLAADSDILNHVGVPPDIRLVSDVAWKQTNSSNLDTLNATYSQLSDKIFRRLSKGPGLLRDCKLFDYRMPESIKRDWIWLILMFLTLSVRFVYLILKSWANLTHQY